jgi:hypothetical protein
MADRSSTQTVLPIREMYLRRNIGNLICEQVSPAIYVDKKRGKYYRADDSNLVTENDILSSRGGANETDHGYSSAEYIIHSHGLKEWIDGDVYDEADSPISEEGRQDTILNIKDKLLLNKEKALKDILFNASNFSGQTSALTGTNRWDDANSDPTDQFKLANTTVLQNSGYMPNSLIIGYEVMVQLAYNAAFASLMPYQNEKVVTAAVLSKLLNINGINIPEDNIYVGSAQTKTSASGTASFIWGKSALFCYIDKKAQTKRADTLVKTFRLKGNKGEKFQFFDDADKTKKGEWASAEIDYGHELVNYKCGYLFTTVIN